MKATQRLVNDRLELHIDLDDADIERLLADGKGGPGSGNWGHGGRPGSVGGSGGGGVSTDKFLADGDVRGLSSERNQELRKELSGSATTLNEQQTRALDRYSRTYYRDINEKLINGTALDKDEAELVKHIDEALNIRAGNAGEVVTYRGLKIRTEEDLQKAVGSFEKAIQEGKTVSSLSYSSTSLDPSVAASFTDRYPVVFEIATKSGSPMGKEGIERELEILLKRNTELKPLRIVKDVNYLDDRGRDMKVTVIQMEEV